MFIIVLQKFPRDFFFQPRISISAKPYEMGNAQARQRLRGSDFHYLSKFTAFANNEVRTYTWFKHIHVYFIFTFFQLVEEYYTRLMDKNPDGKMDVPDFIGQ